ncbi:type I restriction enzyme S subunit [Methanococcus maripaludis]|uniref:ASCH domain-containing protein n=2 Tax=Methanococcus maripaludis TaxID=39152 RepID=Q6LZ45_METMP|nr:hypothetical protein [Methanococcus maripaludis]MBA2850820.1 type I restriction enzyme S subunit [Methanococcus maripaludis]MBB6066523.1 type I restriction enzyme S subunit [Methanococcus maripaludis]MDK2928620.1 hypothetical protein [Methanococcus sp.]CAF30340.1 conserved hypothetical protein [Methanococcus maripaludis S2]
MTILLSIKPKYVKEILNGSKKYEFRKSIFKKYDKNELVFIYSSYPVKRIVGTFSVGDIIENCPKILWNEFKNVSGIKESEFFKYFKEKDKGYAIQINKLNEFKNPVNPKDINPDFRAPQSFCYISQNFEEEILFKI